MVADRRRVSRSPRARRPCELHEVEGLAAALLALTSFLCLHTCMMIMTRMIIVIIIIIMMMMVMMMVMVMMVMMMMMTIED